MLWRMPLRDNYSRFYSSQDTVIRRAYKVLWEGNLVSAIMCIVSALKTPPTRISGAKRGAMNCATTNAFFVNEVIIQK